MNKPNNRGFTLIELLLVVVVMGLMLAVIVPRAWRANIDAKYGNIRQDCSELASFAMQWSESQMAAQDSSSTATLKSYLTNLAGSVVGVGSGAWIAQAASNWNKAGQAASIAIVGRRVGGGAADVRTETSVEALIAPEKIPRNPFNGAGAFLAPQNNPGAAVPIPGAIACGAALDASQGGSWTYYALVFQGTDSTTGTLADPTSFHGGMNTTLLPGLRNGIFMARVQ